MITARLRLTETLVCLFVLLLCFFNVLFLYHCELYRAYCMFFSELCFFPVIYVLFMLYCGALEIITLRYIHKNTVIRTDTNDNKNSAIKRHNLYRAPFTCKWNTFQNDTCCLSQIKMYFFFYIIYCSNGRAYKQGKLVYILYKRSNHLISVYQSTS